MANKLTNVRVPKCVVSGIQIVRNHWHNTRGTTLTVEVTESLFASAFMEYLRNERDLPQPARDRLQGIIDELTDIPPNRVN